MREETRAWLEADWQHGWHPFTDQSKWEGQEDELILVRGEGSFLEDSEGRRYYDGNSSIWTNVHGHSHPKLIQALAEQSGELCHSSYLGFGNARASELAARLCGHFPEGTLERCFFSDNGSTAVEAALRMELQWRHLRGEGERRIYVTFKGSYHGDTLGAASLGNVSRFFEPIAGLGPEVVTLERVEELETLPTEKVAAIVIEPLIQGVNQMKLWPTGVLAQLRNWCDESGAHLILDEVMTGFGRTGTLFACEQEGVSPDYLCLAKGLTGGVMPLAATLTTSEIYEEFKGEGKTFYYGHSYTGNALGCAVALANLDLCEEAGFLKNVKERSVQMRDWLCSFEEFSSVRTTRCLGMVAAIELAADGSGVRGKDVCKSLRELGFLTRPILDTVVWMPPLASSKEEIDGMGERLSAALSKAGC